MKKLFLTIVLASMVVGSLTWFLPAPSSLYEGHIELSTLYMVWMMFATNGMIALTSGVIALYVVRAGGTLFTVWKYVAYALFANGISWIFVLLSGVVGFGQSTLLSIVFNYLFITGIISAGFMLPIGVRHFISIVLSKRTPLLSTPVLIGVTFFSLGLGCWYAYSIEVVAYDIAVAITMSITGLTYVFSAISLFRVMPYVQGLFRRAFFWLTIAITFSAALHLFNIYLQFNQWNHWVVRSGIHSALYFVLAPMFLWAVLHLKRVLSTVSVSHTN